MGGGDAREMLAREGEREHIETLHSTKRDKLNERRYREGKRVFLPRLL